MCGICGKLSFAPKAETLAPLPAMLATLSHRGPDAQGIHTDLRSDVAMGLAHARLSIIDLSERGRQPMCNETADIWLVCNGEVYNYVELADELQARGHRFSSRCDSEVILHGYEEWGTGVLGRLRGMFAFALWDGPHRRLLCARDAVGIKPLYYRFAGGQFWFASELKAILSDPAVPREIDRAGLLHYLAYGHAMAPHTMVQGIRKVLPGHYLLVEEGRIQSECYWDVPLSRIAGSEAELTERTRAILSASVRRHMVSDVPVGAFLSGGLDSSAVVALMRQFTGETIKTFSVGFERSDYNEATYARLMAGAIGTEHRDLVVTAADFVQALPRVVWHYDEPFADAAGVPVYLLSQFARPHVKVVLTGEGSDELFAGYRRTSVERFAQWYNLLPQSLRVLVSDAAGRLPRMRRVKKALETFCVDDPAERYAGWLTVFSQSMRHELLEAAAAGSAADAFEPYRRYQRLEWDVVGRVLYTDFKTWLPDAYLEKVDKSTMAFALEARVPFLDQELVEFAFSLPSALKIKGLRAKHILKQALRGVVPEAIRHRPKHGFSVPTDPWFRGPLYNLVTGVLLDDRVQRRGILRRPYVERLLREHHSGAQVRDGQIYTLLMFELWCSTFLDDNVAEQVVC